MIEFQRTLDGFYDLPVSHAFSEIVDNLGIRCDSIDYRLGLFVTMPYQYRDCLDRPCISISASYGFIGVSDLVNPIVNGVLSYQIVRPDTPLMSGHIALQDSSRHRQPEAEVRTSGTVEKFLDLGFLSLRQNVRPATTHNVVQAQPVPLIVTHQTQQFLLTLFCEDLLFVKQPLSVTRRETVSLLLHVSK